MKAPDQVAELVERFEQHRDTYRSGRYNEAQLREEFLNPFFEALGAAGCPASSSRPRGRRSTSATR